MSKEIAQTVSGSKIAWLLAIVAAFAVLATLGTQWNKSEAALITGLSLTSAPASGNVNAGSTVTYTATQPVDANATNGSVSVALPANVTLSGTPTCSEPDGGAPVPTGTTTITCTFANGAAAAGNVVLTVNATVNNVANGTVISGATATATDGTNNDAAGPTANLTVNGVTGSGPGSVPAGSTGLVFTFNVPDGLTACQDTGDMVGYVPVAGDFTITNGTFVSATAATNADPRVTTVTVDPVAPGNVSVQILTHTEAAAAGAGCTASTAVVAAVVVPELRHVDDDGEYIFQQEIPNNVRGSRHTVCFVAEDTAIDAATDVAGIPVNVGTNFTVNFTNQAPDAYNGDENVIPQSPTANDLSRFIGNGTNGVSGASCFSYYSLGAGDQIITASYVGEDGEAYDVRWDNQGTGQRGLVKEWNVLEDSTVVISATGAGVTGTGTYTFDINDGDSERVVTVPLYLNPNGGYYDFNGTVTITDTFGGSHLNSGAQPEIFTSLAGVSWTASATNDCAVLGGLGNGTTALNATDPSAAAETLEGASYAIVGTPSITVSAFDDCVLGDEIVITITGSEGNLGSGTGLTAVQRIRIVFTIPAPTQKQVFLAWAGQRIILEHDWRIGPGDDDSFTSDGPAPVGFCPFDEQPTGIDNFIVTYVKGSGPGNFLTGLGASINGSDQASVLVNADDVSQTVQNGPAVDNDIPGTPQGNCISRVLFESEDQGQVDIEAFVDEDSFAQNIQVAGQFNVTKHAFVIYYMKLNTVNLSLVTQAEKPTHNGTDGYTMAGFVGTGLYSDWAGVGTTTSANPWNSSLDDADNAAEWNVSKDILARVRVTGWFLTTNPSGRPADTSNPLNILPANRWVMPDDWAQLNGGPIDAAGLNETTDNIGTAEEFRDYYDLMIAPNNAANLALNNPTGSTTATVGVVAATNTGTGAPATPIVVTSCVGLTPGTGSVFQTSTSGTNLGSVVSCVNNLLVVTSPAATAANVLLVVATVPFEGPYSLLDILGLAAQNGGNAGAALSNLTQGSTRDTTWQDGDVDAWDAPMPPAEVSIKLRGTGFLKPVYKSDVYYLGTANTTTQRYPNPYYIQNIPDSPFIPAIAVGSGYLWNSWGNDGPGGNGDGPYMFWQWALVGTNANGVGETLSAADQTELAQIAKFHGTVARDAVIYTDNHGEGMFAANGDFKTDLTACATNALAGGKHCATGDKVGTATITATADYPDFVGKHFPVLSNTATVDWLWGGYKDVTVHPGETDQFKYVVFHAMDRDGFCGVATGRISLHSVLTSVDDLSDFATGLGARYNGDPDENVDFLIDSGEGIIIDSNNGSASGGGNKINDGRQFASGITTFSTAANNPATSGILEFPLSPLAAENQADECQAWIKVSNSLLGIVNVLTIAHDDEGNIGFDRVIDLSNTMSYTLNFRWSLITWAGADGIAVSDALKGTGTGGQNPGGNDISASVTAIYGWDAAAQQWLGYFPSGVNVPGANDLNSLNTGDAYWIAITGPSSVTWTIATNIN